MSRPTDRTCEIQPLGDIDHAAGEFWATNPFAITKQGENLSAYERNKFYLSVDGHKFFDASFASNTDIDSDSRSAIGSDFNRDGKPDLLVASAGGGPLKLFINEFQNQNKYLKIELEGTQSNRDAIGSRVVLEMGEKKIYRDLFPANGCMGLGPVELLVGVGEVAQVDKVTIRWPTGKTKVIENVDVSKVLSVTEE